MPLGLANDAVGHEPGSRIEGSLAASIPSAVITVVTGLFSGVYETGLAVFGYDVTLGMAQPPVVQGWIIHAPPQASSLRENAA